MSNCWSRVLLLLSAHFIVSAAAQRNITVDDSDPLITYTGVWITSAPSGLDQGGAHHLAEDEASFAKFTFTGTAVYFMAPLWPYDVFTQIALDSQPAVELNLSDPNYRVINANGPETVLSAVVWGSGPLPNGSHTLSISKIPWPDRPYAIVDALVYTVLDSPPDSSFSSLIPSASAPSSSLTGGNAVPTNGSNKTSPKSSALPAALGAVAGFLVVLVIIVILCRRCRRGNQVQLETGAVTSTLDGVSHIPGHLSPGQPQIQHPYNPYPNQQPYGHGPDISWSGSGTHASATSAPLVADTRPTAYYGNKNPSPQPMQDFDPFAGLAPIGGQVQYRDRTLSSSERHPSTTFSDTVTGTSTPATHRENASPQDIGGNPTQLSYTSHGSGNGAPAAVSYQQYQQQQHLYSHGSAGELRPLRLYPSHDGRGTGPQRVTENGASGAEHSPPAYSEG